jgi:hypothetical protein
MDYVSNIRSFYDRASAQDIIDGRTWYPSMARIMREHANRSGLRVRQCAAIYAATSINTPWSRNLALAAQSINDYENGYDALRNGGTLRMVVSKVRRIIASTDDTDIDAILTKDRNNYKIVSFTRNLCDDDAVTVDRWAYRIATNFEGCTCTRSNTHGCGKVPTGREYIAIANAYREVAKLVNERVQDLQAITWCVVRGTGE